MKGRTIALDHFKGDVEAAALLINGKLDDSMVDLITESDRAATRCNPTAVFADRPGSKAKAA